MRLVLKLTLAIVAGMCAVLAIHGYLEVQREVALNRADMQTDHYAMGRAFGAAVAEVWHVEGEGRALQLVKELNEREQLVSIRWVWLAPSASDAQRPHVALEQLKEIGRSTQTVSVEAPAGDGHRLYTYVGVPLDDPRIGALEISESLALEDQYKRTTVLSTTVTTAVIGALSGLIAMVIGVWFVGRPMRDLIDQARRVGAGDLSGRLAVRQGDEIGALATEMNAMAGRLADANQKLEGEVAARIATVEQLRHADRLATVGKLASGIAHELGTPLNVVSARAKMIAASEVHGDEIADNARIIVEQSHRMTSTIRQLLDFARSRSPQKATADLAHMTQQVLTLLTPLASKRGVTLSFLDDAGAATASVDSAQLQQALTNLVVNGIQSMRRGGRLSVHLSTAHLRPPADHGGPTAGYMRLDVADEGEGIPPSAIDHIFEPFFTTKSVGEGTGLGLSVAYGIVREHGGWIAVESQLGKGSCFSICLPL